MSAEVPLYRELITLYKGVTILYLKRLVRGFKRSQAFVKEEYEGVWSKWEQGKGNFMHPTPILCFKEGKLVKIVSEEVQASNLQSLAKVLEGETVLELGSGLGINLFVLSLLCPNVKAFEGIELTDKGVELSRKHMSEPPVALLARLSGLSEQDVRNKFDSTKFTFRQGSLLELPYDDNSFDAVFTHEVFEQMPYDYPVGMKEAHRVTKKNAYFIEGFREADTNVFQRMHKFIVDYFRFSARVVLTAGFSSFQIIKLPLVKAKIGEALVIAKK